jgi:hypothetical protein
MVVEETICTVHRQFAMEPIVGPNKQGFGAEALPPTSKPKRTSSRPSTRGLDSSRDITLETELPLPRRETPWIRCIAFTFWERFMRQIPILLRGWTP